MATPGKRARRLIVVATASGERTSFGRALARNALKFALPWTLGHLVVFALADSTTGIPSWIIPVTAITYALPIVYIISLFLGDGRTLYDRVAGTSVVPAE